MQLAFGQEKRTRGRTRAIAAGYARLTPVFRDCFAVSFTYIHTSNEYGVIRTRATAGGSHAG